MAVKVKLSEGEREGLAFIIEESIAFAELAKGDPDEVAYWGRAKAMDECLASASEADCGRFGFKYFSHFEVELTDEALAWMRDRHAELQDGVEDRRGSVEFKAEDVVALFVFDTIARQLEADAPALKAVA